MAGKPPPAGYINMSRSAFNSAMVAGMDNFP